MNFVIVDNTFSFEQILNFPFALGSFNRACKSNEEAIQLMMGHRIHRAEHKEREILRELLKELKAQELVDRLDRVTYTDEILIYEPSPVRGEVEDLIVPELTVRLPDAFGEGVEETFSFWEHPIIRNVPGFTLLGRYYGYPECCIETFIERAHLGMAHPHFTVIGERSQGYPCIVCDKHAEMKPAEVEEIVNKNRHASYPVDKLAGPVAADRPYQQLHYLLALQQGKLTKKYDIGD